MRSPLLILLGAAALALGACDGEPPGLTEYFDLRGAPIDPHAHEDEHAEEEFAQHSEHGGDEESESGTELDPELFVEPVDVVAAPQEAPVDPSPELEPPVTPADDELQQPAASETPEPAEVAVEEPDAPESPAPDADSDELLRISFDELAFADYDPPELRDDDEDVLPFDAFPEDVQDLHGRRISIDGFMVALEVSDRQVDTFMLHRFPPGCCFGSMPLMDEWIEVNVTDGEGQEFSPYQMITVQGRFEVGEEVDEDGFVLSLYRLSGSASEAL